MLCAGLSACLSAPSGFAADAELPIYGGLGVELGEVLPAERSGAEVIAPSGATLPDNRNLELPPMEPGAVYPWRYLVDPQLPRLFREQSAEAYVMLNSNREVMRVLAHIQNPDCADNFDWLKHTISKKYEVSADAEYSAAPQTRSLRITFSSRQIDVHCGKRLTIDYLDLSMISVWADTQQRRYAEYQRQVAQLEKREMVLERRKQLRFADTFTMGDQFRLDGAFGVQFEQPFAKNSTQNFPVDEPFYAVLPGMPEPFTKGDLQLTISPDKHPIVIRGRFPDIDFERIAAALRTKYGLPMKESSRHIIHKVNGDHVIIKRLDRRLTELAFIDTSAQDAHRQRLWNKESEGL